MRSRACSCFDRQKGMSDCFSEAPADGTLAAHCRPNGNSALPVSRGSFWQNTPLGVAEEVTTAANLSDSLRLLRI
jgi:hypothetical protein